eukprot:144768_1
MAQYVAHAANAPDLSQSHLKEKIDLFISCNDLKSKDLNSTSDPFVVVYVRVKNVFQELGRTEAMKDNPNPTFATQFKMDYYFEEQQVLRFDVYDEDKKGSQKLKDHDFIGSATMILGEIIHEKGQILSKKLLNKKKSPIKNSKSKKYSSVTITAEKVAGHGNELITLQISMKGLAKMDGLFGKSDPYFTISRSREDGKSVVVYKSIVIKSNLNPIYDFFQIETQTLCNCDGYRPITISVYDWDKSGNDDLIGHVQTNLNELRSKPQHMTIVGKKSTKQYGEINVIRFKAKALHGFLDYIEGGAEISLCVAIDFTGSNGHAKDNQSLHYIYGGQPSQYQNAIRQIGNIISAYDFDKKFPVWGFGAWMNKVVYHDFALNFDETNPEVHGIYGIEQSYLNAIRSEKFQFSGPTLFEPILKKAKACGEIAHKTNDLYYLILLILTDGIINDMKQTKDAIVEMANSNLPISIIIVGVGNADFAAMHELDGDDHGLMNSKGKYAKRDIVQFVRLNAYNSLNELSKETLMEIPKQFVSYAKFHGIVPGQKQKAQRDGNLFAMSEDEMKEQQYGALEADASAYDPTGDMFANAPLPTGWERGYDENGRPYYVNEVDKTTQWEHPSSIQNQ